MRVKKMICSMILAAAMIVPMAWIVSADADNVIKYENDGLILNIPEEYDDLLIVDTPEESHDDILFAVCEKASVEAAKENGYKEEDGLGFIFSISRMPEDMVQEMMCEDMSGCEVFATDQEGRYYLYNHPTDVRIEFAKDADRDAAMEQWGMLNEWAWENVRKDFVSENEGLTEKPFSNTTFNITLARIAYRDFKDYTISTLEFGPLDPKEVDPAPFIARLDGVKLTKTDDEFPDGEYTVLGVPEEGRRYDISVNADGEDFIREVISFEGSDSEDVEIVYKAELPDDSSETVTKVMQDWYQALAEANGKTE